MAPINTRSTKTVAPKKGLTKRGTKKGPTKTVVKKKRLTKRAATKRSNLSCYVETSSSSTSCGNSSSSSSSDSDSTTSCSDSMCSDCCDCCDCDDCKSLPYSKRVDKTKNKQNKAPTKATNKGKTRPVRRGKNQSRCESSSGAGSDECYRGAPKQSSKPSRRPRV